MRQAGQSNQDRELVVAFKGGDERAYEEIYHRYYDRVHKTCMRILGNPADAAEATQETFLRGFRGLHRFNGRYQLGAWLTRIASNVAVDALRARSRSVNVVATTDEVVEVEERLKRSDDAAEDKVAITMTLDEMQPLHAQALFLRAVEGLSHQEMASRLEMSSAQVKSLLHRSRRSFKRAWEQASGWALAPLGRFGWTRAKNDGFAAASPGTGIMLERVATSAVAAAIVVAGFSGGGGTPPPSEVPRFRAPGSVPVEKPSEEETVFDVRSEKTADEAPAVQPKDESLLAAVADLKETVASELPEKEDETSDDRDGIPLSEPTGKRPLTQEVEKTVDEARGLLGEEHVGGKTR